VVFKTTAIDHSAISPSREFSHIRAQRGFFVTGLTAAEAREMVR
jgi:hypothetical protein